MRNYLIFLSCGLLLFISLKTYGSNETDSLRQKRSDLITQYIDIISIPRSSPGTERRIFDLQNRIITIDNVLIDDHFENAIASREIALRELQAEKQKTAELQQKIDAHTSLAIIIAVIFIALLILALIFITILSVKNKGLRKKVNLINNDKALIKMQRDNILKLQEEIEFYKNQTPDDHQNEIEKLQQKLAEQEKNAGEMHVENIRLKSEKRQLEEKIEDLTNKSADSSSDISDSAEAIEELEQLRNQLNETRQLADNLTEQNRIMSQELERTMENEKIKNSDNDQIRHELESLAAEKQRLTAQLEQTKQTLEKVNEEPDIEIIKLQKKIEIYEEQLKAEEKARQDFEKQINKILSEYKEHINSLLK
ncbi:MAG: hypothetical protein EA393_08625 [Bacteroidetes bacterium]|nr:MAG: hypothetical protein EA393_08625 [Bacteroidota bacterium]